MTTETLDAILAERWHMASTAVQTFANESFPSQVPSQDEMNLTEAIRNLGTRMVHEIGLNEESALDDLEFACLAAIETEVLHFARLLESERAAKAVAA